MKNAFLITWLATTALALLNAQTQSTLPADANVVYQAKDWAKAQTLYESLTQSEPGNARNWFRFGVALKGTGKHQQALDAFQKSKALGAPRRRWDTTSPRCAH